MKTFEFLVNLEAEDVVYRIEADDIYEAKKQLIDCIFEDCPETTWLVLLGVRESHWKEFREV